MGGYDELFKNMASKQNSGCNGNQMENLKNGQKSLAHFFFFFLYFVFFFFFFC